jgi:hypothetical protein
VIGVRLRVRTRTSSQRHEVRVRSTPETFQDAWPQFVGPSVLPRISQIVDQDDGSRSLDLVNIAHMDSLARTQTLNVLGIDWLVPSGKEIPVEGKTEITRVVRQ